MLPKLQGDFRGFRELASDRYRNGRGSGFNKETKIQSSAIKSQLDYMLPHDTFAITPVLKTRGPSHQSEKSAQKVIAKVS